MALSDSQLVQLKEEIDSDPSGLGYAGQSFREISTILNRVRSGQTVNREIVTAGELQAQLLMSEFIGLTDAARQGWQSLLLVASSSTFNLNTAALRAQITEIWSSGVTTRNSLVALQTRQSSRAEALFGENVIVTDREVEEASLL